MTKLLTKKNTLLMAFIGCVTFVLFAFQKDFGFCGKIYNDCWDIIDFIWPLLSSFPPFLLFSILTYKMSDEIFHAWIRFAKWWVPLSILVLLVTPKDIPGTFSVPVKEPFALAFSSAFLVVSLVLIAYKHFTLKKGGAGK